MDLSRRGSLVGAMYDRNNCTCILVAGTWGLGGAGSRLGTGQSPEPPLGAASHGGSQLASGGPVIKVNLICMQVFILAVQHQAEIIFRDTVALS